ncbi:hypothetical protein NQ318_011933 [Aromia moschata]|uniref:ZAD domain-containing protein n=1 Tax=Aromia moschata TaxID=1265417 RepID=A0AAV8XGM0_9CUCU|nr:hypothetical protein NQ318_011933 [Aromia moschata]
MEHGGKKHHLLEIQLFSNSLDIKLEHEEVTETEAQDVRALSIRSKHSDEVYCRLCLEQTTKSTYLPLGDIDLNYPDETEEFKNVKRKQIDEVQTMINMCFPFYEPLTFNPVVCSNCISQLKLCYEFTAKVTQNQQLINTYINTSGATENLANITDVVHSKLNQDVDNSFHQKTDSINTLSQKDTQESAITPIPGQKRVHEHEIESGLATIGKKQKTALHIQDDCDITVKQEPIDPLEHDLDISQNVLDTTDIKVELDYIDTPDLIKTEMEEQFQDTTHLDQSGLSGHSIHPNNTLEEETSFSSPGGTSENLMVHSSKKQRIKK